MKNLQDYIDKPGFYLVQNVNAKVKETFVAVVNARQEVIAFGNNAFWMVFDPKQWQAVPFEDCKITGYAPNFDGNSCTEKWEIKLS